MNFHNAGLTEQTMACASCVISSWPQKLSRPAFPARGQNASQGGVPPNAFFAHWSLLRHYRRMVGLSDSQLKIVMTAANAVPVERRSVFLERVGAMLKPRGRFSDDDVRQVAALAMASSEFLAADFSGSG